MVSHQMRRDGTTRALLFELRSPQKKHQAHQDCTTIVMENTTQNNTIKSSAWRPLRVPIFRNLLVANLVSDIGTFMQNVGAAWMMVSFGVGPAYVALIQTAAALPFFVLAPVAGSVGDIVDRRKLILFTETWMILAALAIALLTISGTMSPWILL